MLGHGSISELPLSTDVGDTTGPTPTGPNPVVSVFSAAVVAIATAVTVAACAPAEFDTRIDHAIKYRPFKNGAIYGMSATALPPQQVFVAAEPQRPADTSQALHALRSPPAAQPPTASTPRFVWVASYRLDAVELELRRADHDTLHRFRTSFQTVGQPWQMWSKSRRVEDALPEWAQPQATDQTPLYGRTTPVAPPSAGQTYTLWQPPARLSDPEWEHRRRDYWAELAPHRLLPTYGMAVSLLPPTPVLIESWEPRQPDRSAEALFYGRAVSAPPPSAGQPWFIWQAKAPPIAFSEDWSHRVTDHARALQPFLVSYFVSSAVWATQPAIGAEEFDARVDHSALLTMFRRTAAAATPGQPWYLQKVLAPTVTAEAFEVKPDHSALLTVLRHPAVEPPAATAGQPWYFWKPAQPSVVAEEWQYRSTDHATAFELFNTAYFVSAAVWATQPAIEPEQYTVRVDHGTTLLTMFGRQPGAVVPQPWSAYRWQIPTPDTLEWFWYERPREHWSALFPFLITPTTPATPATDEWIIRRRRRRR